MKTTRMYRYRIYPTPEQEAVLHRWMGVLRFLWNACHEQRLRGYARDRLHRVYPDASSQKKEMTLAQETEGFEWIQDVQCQARQKILEDLDDAWKRCFKKIAKAPHWKKKGDSMRIYAPTGTVDADLAGEGKKQTLTFNTPRYKPLGPLSLVLDRSLPPEGRVTSWSITKEVVEWYATAAVELDLPAPAPSTKPAVGIDRGVVLMLADSDGRTVPRPPFLDDSRELIERAQRKLARKKKGSKNFRKAVTRLAKVQQRVARSRAVMVNTESKFYADHYGVVVLEDLKIGNMTRSAKGTEEEPGKNVRQKAGLNRAILNAGWGAFERTLQYKIEAQGGKTVKVPAPYTSQGCSKCGNVDPENRVDQATFRCKACGYERNADTNAACNILARGLPLLTEGPKAKKPVVKMSRTRRKPKAEPTVKPTVAACEG